MPDYIPREIVIKILKLLPAESLFRFRRVCQWMTRFIDSPSFIQDHLALQKPRIIAMYEGRELLVVNPHTPSMAAALFARRSESERVNLVGTLHGIVCFYYYNSHFMLCNLSIRKSLILPLPDLRKPALTDYVDEIYNDNKENDENSVFSGFWIDSSTKNFKILIFRLLDPPFEHLNNVILYSSITQDWEPLIPSKVRMYPSLSERLAVVIGEVGYWKVFAVIKYEGVRNRRTAAAIVSFDFKAEGFDMIEAPHPEYRMRCSPVLSRWQDTLSLVFVDEENHCEVYFREAEDLWVKKFSFNLTNATNITRVLSMVESEGQDSDLEEDSLDNRRILAATSSHELVLCDKGPAYISLKTELLDEFTLCLAYDYVGSLLFPQGEFK